MVCDQPWSGLMEIGSEQAIFPCRLDAAFVPDSPCGLKIRSIFSSHLRCNLLQIAGLALVRADC
jgi:hypothetical protein